MPNFIESSANQEPTLRQFDPRQRISLTSNWVQGPLLADTFLRGSSKLPPSSEIWFNKHGENQLDSQSIALASFPNRRAALTLFNPATSDPRSHQCVHMFPSPTESEFLSSITETRLPRAASFAAQIPCFHLAPAAYRRLPTSRERERESSAAPRVPWTPFPWIRHSSSLIQFEKRFPPPLTKLNPSLIQTIL